MINPRSAAGARARARALGVAERCAFIAAVAEGLPFADGEFDLVTCQTVLIHVADVAAVLREMRRVTRPGGALLLSEPNNLAGALVADERSAAQSPSAWGEMLTFLLTCESGRAMVGEGSAFAPDLLPGQLAELGFEDIRTYLNDRPFPLTPPHDAPQQQALRDVIVDAAGDERWVWVRLPGVDNGAVAVGSTPSRAAR